jgi:hypothetical protein
MVFKRNENRGKGARVQGAGILPTSKYPGKSERAGDRISRPRKAPPLQEYSRNLLE